MLENAIDLDDNLVQPMGSALYLHYHSQGMVDQAREWRDRVSDHEVTIQLANEERDQLNDRTTRFIPHDPTQEQLDELRADLARVHKLNRAFLVQRALQYLPKNKLHVIVIEYKEPLGFAD